MNLRRELFEQGLSPGEAERRASGEYFYTHVHLRWIGWKSCQEASAEADLIEALRPFVASNSSEELVTITVRSEEVARARAAIAKTTGGAT